MKPLLLLLPFAPFLTACSRAAPPAADDFAGQRTLMVEQQLAGRDIDDPKVLDAMKKVPRHKFVPEDVRPLAYADTPLPIGHEQTISQPYIVAFMTEQLDPKPDDRVLEIGTGSGYQAAVLGELVDHVYTIEIVEPLAERAKQTLDELDYDNVTVMAGDGYKGWPEHAPFDSVIVTAAPEQVPQPLVDQLKEGGRMVIPVGKQGAIQQLRILTKKAGEVEEQALMPVQFVPMTGESQQQ